MNKRELKYISLIFVIFIAACIETDIYLPAFCDMMNYFSCSEEQIQSLLTWNFIGICLSGPLYGPISDAVGRKKPLMTALGLFLLGSSITLFAENFDLMLWGRFLQGVGSGGCFTLGTAIIFDAFQAEKSVRALNILNSTIPFLMAFAPMLGGYLNLVYGFRSNFFAIFVFVLISFIICLFFFDESLAKEKRSEFQPKKIVKDFKRAMSSRPFWQLTIALSLMFAGYLAFLSGTSVLFVMEFGVSKELFPFFQAALLGAWLVASMTCSRCIDSFGTFKVKFIGTSLVVIGGLGFIISYFLNPKDPYLPTWSMMIYSFGCNWTQGLYFPEAMELLPDIKGITASIITSARLFLTAIIVGIASSLYDSTIFPLLGVIVGIIAVILPLIVAYERKSARQSLVV